MRRIPLLLIACILSLITTLGAADAPKAGPIAVGANDWPWWRGPTRNGVAAPGQKPPLSWSETENVVWKAPVPGRGHGSPIVVGDQVFVATAEQDRKAQSVLCLDRQTGKQLWQTDVHHNGLDQTGNGKSTFASTTPACDGERVFVNFMYKDGIYTTALDRKGKQLWQTRVTDYVLHQGFASSPAVYDSLVIVNADNKGMTGLVAGLERTTGKIVWKRDRPHQPNYASPIILNIFGKDQLLIIGCDLVTSLNPKTGEQDWEIKGATTECVTSTPTDGKNIFTSGGYPKNHVAAVRADGSGKVVWEKATKVYVPSMLLRAGHLYAVGDEGAAVCWNSETGKEVWKGRLEGNFSSSPVLVGDLIFAMNEAGRTFVFKASPKEFDLVAENQLGNEVLASPAICGNRIYTRVAFQQKGKRQEMLVCLGR